MDDKTNTGEIDLIRINRDEPEEVRNWSHELNVTKSQLLKTISAVGPVLEDVKRHLGK